MKLLKASLIVLGSLGLIGLGACSNSNQATNPNNSPNVAKPAQSTAQPSSEAQTESSGHAATPQAGGQVVESGPYHLEFVPETEADGTHMDFFLQKGDNHEAIPNAKVTAQVQLPDGTPKTINMNYDTEGKHYTALLPEKATGEYKVAILSEINGEKVNGRFIFSR
jgi:hypothetical protein